MFRSVFLFVFVFWVHQLNFTNQNFCIKIAIISLLHNNLRFWSSIIVLSAPPPPNIMSTRLYFSKTIKDGRDGFILPENFPRIMDNARMRGWSSNCLEDVNLFCFFLARETKERGTISLILILYVIIQEQNMECRYVAYR